MNETFHCSMSSLGFDVISILDFSHFHGCVVISYYYCSWKALTAADEHHAMCVRAICTFSLVRYLFRPLTHFVLLSYILDTSSLSGMCSAYIFSQCVACIFILLATCGFLFVFFKILFIYFYRGVRGEREGEKNIQVQEIHPLVACHTPPTGDLACNPNMCPDWESNQQPFSSQASTQSTEPPARAILLALAVAFMKQLYWGNIDIWRTAHI